jgi:hypothetical protein
MNATMMNVTASKRDFGPGADVSSTFAEGALWQKFHAQQESKEEPSRKHHGHHGRSQPCGKASASSDLRQKSVPFWIVIQRGARPVRSEASTSLDVTCWIKRPKSHERPSRCSDA